MPKEWKPNSFSTQWLMLGIALSVLAAATAFNLYSDRKRIERNEQDRLLAQSRVLQENIEANLAAIATVLDDVRRNLPRHLAARELGADIKMLIDAMPGVRTLSVLDAAGNMVASNRAELLGKNFAFREYFDTPRRRPDPDNYYVSAPFKTSLGIHAVNVTRTISGPGSEFGGIITATLDPEYFKTIMDSVLYAPDMWTALGHGDGILFMMMPDRPQLSGINLAQPGSFFVRHQDSGEDATIMAGTVRSTSEERMIAQRTVHLKKIRQDKPLVVAVSRDLDAIFASWRQAARMQGALLVILALLAAAALHIYQRRFTELARKEAEAAAALANSERFMRVLTDNLPGMVGYWTDELRCRFANKAYLEWFGRTPEQMRGIRIQDLMGEELFRKNEPYMRAALRGERQQFERTLVKADGSTGYTWAHYIPDMDGEHVRGFYVLVTDITELKQAQIALAESERKLKTIIEAEPECVKVVAPDGTLLQMNRAGLDMIEVETEGEVVGHKVAECILPGYRDAFEELNKRVCDGETGSLEFEIEGRKGRRRWVDMRAVPMRDADGLITGVLAVTRDVTARKDAERELEKLAQIDFLTGLANRRHFLTLAEQELSRTLRYGGPLSVFMIDIDHFKNVNDTHGHQAGDRVLQMLGAVCRQVLRDVDIMGRMGGEEFAVMLPQTDHAHAMEAAERLRKAIAAAEVPLEHGLPLRITISIGIASLENTAANIDTLLSQADAALYRAKKTGRNRSCGYTVTLMAPMGHPGS